MRAHPGSRQHRTWRAGCSGRLGTPGPPSAVGTLSGGQARGETQEVAGPVERMRCTQYLQGLGRKGLRDHTGHTAARASCRAASPPALGALGRDPDAELPLPLLA